MTAIYCARSLACASVVLLATAGCSSSREDAVDVTPVSRCAFDCIQQARLICSGSLGVDPNDWTAAFPTCKDLEELKTQFAEVSRKRDGHEQLLSLNISDLGSKTIQEPILLESEQGHIYTVLSVLPRAEGNKIQVLHGTTEPLLVPLASLPSLHIKRAFAIPSGSRSPRFRIGGDGELSVDKSLHFENDARPDSTIQTTFRLSNSSGVELEVSRILPTCACTLASVSGRKVPFSLHPSDHVDLVLKVNLGNSSSFRHSVWLTLRNPKDDRSRIITLDVLGNCWVPVSLIPMELDFGIVNPGGKSTVLAHLDETRSDRFNFKEIVANGAPVECGLIDDHSEGGLKRYQFSFVLSPYGFMPGDYKQSIQMVSYDPVRIIHIPVRFHVRQRVQVVPAAVFFGRVQRGESRSSSLLLSSADATDVGSNLHVINKPDGMTVEIDRTASPTHVSVTQHFGSTSGVWNEKLVLGYTSANSAEELTVLCSASVD